MVGQEAVEEGEVALPQALGVGVALQIAAHRLEGPPAAIHLLSEAFFLPGQQGFEALLQLALARRRQPLAETRFRLAGSPHHQQAIGPWHQIGAGAEDHPLQRLARRLQRQHLALERKYRQLGQ